MNGSSKFPRLFQLTGAPGKLSIRAFWFVAAVAAAGCGDSASQLSLSRAQQNANGCCAIAERDYTNRSGKVTSQQLQRAHRSPYEALLNAHRGEGQEALRVRVDVPRNRLWVLTPDDLYVYDVEKQHLIRRIGLPGWSVTEFICPPDLALDPAGTAFVSDNAQPRLWRIDADTFHPTEHVIRLLHKEHWDIGFGRLAFTADGTLLGLTASGGSLWSIDVDNARAREVELGASSPDACPLVPVP